MQYQILQIETMSILWQTEGRIINEILGVTWLKQFSWSYFWVLVVQWW